MLTDPFADRLTAKINAEGNLSRHRKLSMRALCHGLKQAAVHTTSIRTLRADCHTRKSQS